MSFITNQFWISLYMQEVQKLAPLHIAVRLLPQAVAGVLWSYVGQALVHRVNGTILSRSLIIVASIYLRRKVQTVTNIFSLSGYRRCCLFRWSTPSNIHTRAHILLEALVSRSMYHSTGSRFSIHSLKCEYCFGYFACLWKFRPDLALFWCMTCC